MAFPVIYGKTKLASAVGGESIMDAGDLNFSVRTVFLTDAVDSFTVEGVKHSLYVVNATFSSADDTGTLVFDGWTNGEAGQHDNRNTGWVVRVVNNSASQLFISTIVDGSPRALATLSSNDLAEITYSPQFTAGIVAGRSGVSTQPNWMVHYLTPEATS